MPPLLEARNLGKVFVTGGLFAKGATVALDGFSMAISSDRPSFTAVAGESGSGKTTLARLLLGFIRPTSGEVLYRGKDIRHLSGEERRRFRREVQAIFQDPFEVYNPFYKVDHMLETPVRKFKLAGSKPEGRALIEEALRDVGLRPEETLGRYPHELSGGQLQRITVARALLLKPRLIIADEPVSMEDASLRATILESIHRLHRTLGISFIYITHDLATAYQVSESIAVLYRGMVVEAGGTESVIKEPKHPYTRELIASIPLPDPSRRWAEPAASMPNETSGAAEPPAGCSYIARCPHAVSKCACSVPPLFKTDDRHAAACFLHDSTGTAVNGGLTSVLER